jgi:hypothetical protein
VAALSRGGEGMHLFRRFTQGQLHLTSVEAFSDAVFAIYSLTPLFYITPPQHHGKR